MISAGFSERRASRVHALRPRCIFRSMGPVGLKNPRQFYLTFPHEQKLYALRRELSWTHYRLLMRVDDARGYYIREAADRGWSSHQLECNIRRAYVAAPAFGFLRPARTDFPKPTPTG